MPGTVIEMEHLSTPSTAGPGGGGAAGQNGRSAGRKGKTEAGANKLRSSGFSLWEKWRDGANLDRGEAKMEVAIHRQRFYTQKDGHRKQPK